MRSLATHGYQTPLVNTMPAFLIADADEITCRFVGERIIDIDSDVLEFSNQHAWFELSVYLTQDDSWVVVIVTKRCGAEFDDVVHFHRSESLDAIEDFVFDFDPTADLQDSDTVRYYYECTAVQVMTQLRGVVDYHQTVHSQRAGSIWDRLRALFARVSR